MNGLPALIAELGVFFSDPFVQQVTFGMMCVVASLVAFASREREMLYATGWACTISIFWAVNNFLWTFNTLELSPYTDSLFMAAAFFLFLRKGFLWLFALAVMFAGNVILDLKYLQGVISYESFAVKSNWLFVGELLMVSLSGWINLTRMLFHGRRLQLI